MKGTSLKVLLYIFFIGLIGGVVVNAFAEKDNLTLNIIKFSLFGIALLVVIIYIVLTLICIVDNKKIAKMLNNDEYKNIIEHATKMRKRKTIFLGERKKYYDYLLLLSYLATDQTDKFDEYFEKVDDYFTYPVALYWKAVYNFSIGNLERTEADYDSFVNFGEIQRNHAKYINLIKIFEALHLYKQEKYEDSKKMLDTIDTEHIAMPVTKRALDIIAKHE